MADDNLVIGLAVIAITLSAIAIGLFIGMNFNSSGSRTGYSIDRDSSGRFIGIIPIPMSDLL